MLQGSARGGRRRRDCGSHAGSIRGRGSAGQRQYVVACRCRQVAAEVAEVAEVADTAAMLACPIPAGLWVELKHRGLLRADAPTPA